jgi:hypothetical protein
MFGRSGFVLTFTVLATVNPIVCVVIARIHWFAHVAVGTWPVTSSADAGIATFARSAAHGVFGFPRPVWVDASGLEIAFRRTRVAVALVDVFTDLAVWLNGNRMIALVTVAGVRDGRHGIIHTFPMWLAMRRVFIITRVHLLALRALLIGAFVPSTTVALVLARAFALRASGNWTSFFALLQAAFSALVNVDTHCATTVGKGVLLVAFVALASE